MSRTSNNSTFTPTRLPSPATFWPTASRNSDCVGSERAQIGREPWYFQLAGDRRIGGIMQIDHIQRIDRAKGDDVRASSP